MSAAQQDVLGLDVPVDHPFAVGEGERVRRLARDPERVRQGKLLLPAEPVTQTLAPDEGHGEPEQGRRPWHGQLARVEDGEDVGVLQAGGEMDLAEKPIGSEGGGELGVEHLDRDGAIVLEVTREPDGGHASAAELALEGVPVCQSFAQRRYRIRHAVPSMSFLNRGCSRRASHVGSMRSHPGDRVLGMWTSGSSRSSASSGCPDSRWMRASCSWMYGPR